MIGRGAAEVLAALAVATAVHAAIIVAVRAGQSTYAASPAGAPGPVIAVAGPELSAEVAAWERPPEAVLPLPSQVVVSSGPPELLLGDGGPASADHLIRPDRPLPIPPALAAPRVSDAIPVLPQAAPPPVAPPPPAPQLAAPLPQARPKPKLPPPDTPVDRLRGAEAQPAPPFQQAGPAAPPAGKAAGNAVAKADSAGASPAPRALSGARQESLRSDWGAAIRARIERRKSYPAAAGGARGTVTLKLRVNADGRLTGLTVVTGSGSDALDAAAVRAVTAAGRLPKAPAALGGVAATFTLRIAFTG